MKNMTHFPVHYDAESERNATLLQFQKLLAITPRPDVWTLTDFFTKTQLAELATVLCEIIERTKNEQTTTSFEVVEQEAA